MNLLFAYGSQPVDGQRVEICEHKGIGHPDTLCDGVADAVSRALCSAYLHAYGEIRHHNVDKALLIGGQSMPRFGGGELIVPMRLIIAGRADPLPGSPTACEIADVAARDYLRAVLRSDTRSFNIEPAIRSGSAVLRSSVDRHVGAVRANDTSFGVGFAPYSRLESLVLRMGALMCSDTFRHLFPAAGDDYKIMGRRIDNQFGLTVALAFIDREIPSVARYFELKRAVQEWLMSQLDLPCELKLNALDDCGARDESGLYLTVSGTSAEHGDDGQVGRGNRVSGLITPSRAMSLEATAGKNPIGHVGKIYNVLAMEIAHDLAARTDGVEVGVQLLSSIGGPVDAPELAVVNLAGAATWAEETMAGVIDTHLRAIPDLSLRLAAGACRLF